MFSKARRRGRPPKSSPAEKSRHLNCGNLKKPRYLAESKDDSFCSQLSSSYSRNSSPGGSETSRSRATHATTVARNTRSRQQLQQQQKAKKKNSRSYFNELAEEKDSEYHYGSDFGEDDSMRSDLDESSPSETEEVPPEEPLSDSEFSVSSYSTTAEGGSKRNVVYQRMPTPEPLWLQNRDIPILELPKSSDDLLVPRAFIMDSLSIYEVLRHFRTLIRLSPFRFEDFCAVLTCEEQTYLFAEVHIQLLKSILREEDNQQTHFGALDQKDSVNSVMYFIDGMTWPEALRMYIESDKNFDQAVLNILNSCEYPHTDIENRLRILQFLVDQFLFTSPVREDLIHEGILFRYDE